MTFLKFFFKPERLFIALMLCVIAWLSPVLYRRASPQMQNSADKIIPLLEECSDVGSAHAQSTCSSVCKRQCDEPDICWVYVGTKNGMYEWKAKKCCRSWVSVCSQVCTGPVYSPPTVSGTLNCSQTGNDGWCTGSLSLDIATSDPQGYAVSVEVEDPDTTCTGSCSLDLPAGNGNAGYTATADTSTLSAIGSTAWKRDPDGPDISYVTSGSTLGGWHNTNVTFTASADDPISGLSSLVVKDNGWVVSNPVLLDEGVHSMTMTAIDNAGNTSTSMAAIMVDTTVPSISKSFSTSPSGEWYTQTPVLTVSGSDSGAGLASISVTDNGVPIANSASLSDGIHTIEITATDVAGNSSSDTFTVKVDTTQPDIAPSFTGTSGGHGWYLSAVDVNTAVTDATSGISSTSTLINGMTSSLPATINEDGETIIIFNASDNAGNSVSQFVIVMVDKTQPVMDVSKTGISGDHGWYQSAVDFHITATDGASGPQYGEYRIDGGTWQVGMTFTVSGDGIHTVEYRVFDQAGNAAAQSETIRIDTGVPLVAFTAPSENTPVDKIVQISGTAFDSGSSGLEAVEVSVDGGVSWNPVSVGAWTYDWDVSDISNGAQTVLLRARDSAGNVSSASSLSLLVDTSGPFISIADSWTFDLAGELKIVPDAYDVKTVSIAIMNNAGEVMTSSQHTGSDAPSIVWWDGKYNGVQQPAGEYTVLVTACDVYGVCSTARSTITIPVFYYTLHAESPATPLAIVPAPPIPVVEFIAPPTPAPVEIQKPVQIFGITGAAAKRTGGMLSLVISAALVLLFLGNSILDPRPKAMHSLAQTLRKNIKEYQ